MKDFSLSIKGINEILIVTTTIKDKKTERKWKWLIVCKAKRKAKRKLNIERRGNEKRHL